MLKEIIFLVEEAPEGGYTARALGHSIFTEADTWEQLKEAVQDAVRCHFEEDQTPTLVRLHITIPRHKPLRVGTLNSILRDVAQHFGIDRDTLITSLQNG